MQFSTSLSVLEISNDTEVTLGLNLVLFIFTNAILHPDARQTLDRDKEAH